MSVILQIHICGSSFFTRNFNLSFPHMPLAVSSKYNICDVFPQAVGMNDGRCTVTSVDDTVRLINNH